MVQAALRHSCSTRGERIGRCAVRRVMRVESLRAIQPKRFVPRTTASRHGQTASPNLLVQPEPQATKPMQVVGGDITYLPLVGGGWCYLAIWQAKFTRRIGGWSVAATMTDELVIKALEKAAHKGLLQTGAIIHPDRGAQYVARAFRARLAHSHLRQSMSAKGNCYDNAQAESFFARFKTGLVEGGAFSSVEEARNEAFSYIEGSYNTKRIHSSLGLKTPAEFERIWESKEKEKQAGFVSTFS